MEKTIKIYQKHCQPINSIEEENTKTRDVIINVYERFPSEVNANHHEYAQEKLHNFRYVPAGFCISPGSYIRMIDMRSPYDAKLYSGGFVTFDNGFKTTVIACRRDGTITFNRKKYVFFVQMTMDDMLRAQINSMY
jgi:hypothetical protein